MTARFVMTAQGNIWKFYVYKFISSFFLLGPIIILFFLEYIPYSQFGFVFGVGVVVSFLFEVPSGVWADHFGRKNVVALGTLLSALEIFLIAYGKSFPYFLLAGAIGGLGAALISGADTALLYDSLVACKKTKESKKVFGRARAIRYFSIVIAALIGAPLYMAQNTLPLYLNSAILVFAAVFMLSLYEPPVQQSAQTSYWQTFTKSLGLIKKNKKLVWFIAFSVFSGFGIWLYHDLLRSAYYKAIGYPIAFLGVITAIISIVRSYFSWNADALEKKFGERKMVLLLLLAPVILFLCMGFLQTKVALLFAILLYCVWSLQEVITEASLHEHMSSRERATMFSLYSFVNTLALFIGALVIGFVAEANIFSAVIVLSGVSFVAAVLLLPMQKKVFEK